MPESGDDCYFFDEYEMLEKVLCLEAYAAYMREDKENTAKFDEAHERLAYAIKTDDYETQEEMMAEYKYLLKFPRMA